ncbi:MAG: TonB-dependent receptor [Asticcacaulis sp.]
MAEPDGDDDDGPSAQPVEVVVRAQRLDAARARVEPSLGASTYSFSNALVEARPGGETVSLGQVLSQAPGVSQQGSGQLVVRGGAGLQYRINNVIIPEGFTDLGESLSARFASRIELITGALPAQYGLQTGGVVNITTQNSTYQQGGQYELYGGGAGEIEPAIEYAAASGGTDMYVSASYLQNQAGLPSVTGEARPGHDRTGQLDGFAYVEHTLDDQTRLSLIAGTSDERFQIPHAPGLDAASYVAPGTFQRPLNVQGVSHYPSDMWGGRQADSGRYAVVTYLKTLDRFTVQASLFGHYSTYGLTPDVTGDLLFTGLAQRVRGREATAGLQVEGAYTAGAHIVRAGLLASWDRQRREVASTVLPVDVNGRQTANVAVTDLDRSTDISTTGSLFIEDEWKIAEPLTVNAGLRFDHVRGIAGGEALSPRLNLVWTAADGMTLHGGYARYFVPPQDDAAGRTPDLAGTTGAPFSLANGALRPESDDYYDLGIEKKTAHLTLGIDAYWREARDFIGRAPLGQTLLEHTYNYESGRVRGVEFMANYVKGPLTWWANLALSRAEGRRIVSGQYAFTADELAWLDTHFAPTSQDQAVTASGGASYTFGHLHLSGDVLWGSGTPVTSPGGAPNGARVPGWVQANLSALYRINGIGGKRLDLKLDVVNALDERYRLSDATALGAETAQWGPRRGVFIGFEQSF